MLLHFSQRYRYNQARRLLQIHNSVKKFNLFNRIISVFFFNFLKDYRDLVCDILYNSTKNNIYALIVLIFKRLISRVPII